MEYLIVSTAVTDKLYPYGVKEPTINLGGAGTYALAGIKIWSDHVSLLTGIGKDFTETHGNWFEKNAISMENLLIKHDHTPTTLVHYFEDGEREEIPVLGSEHYLLMEAKPDEIEAAVNNDVKGVYIFKEASIEFWNAIIKLKRKKNFQLLWEINADSAKNEYVQAVKDIGEKVDIFSINITEAKELLNKESTEDVINEFKTWSVPLIFLRVGAKGAYMLYDGQFVHVPSVENVNVVDPTGGGNSSSAGVLYGVCEGYTAFEAGVMGSISASICIEQLGVPIHFNKELRVRAEKLFEIMR